MSERNATICGYTLFITILLIVSCIIYWAFHIKDIPPLEPNCPISINAWIDDSSSPTKLYVIAYLQEDYHIGSINPINPEPLKTQLDLGLNKDFRLYGLKEDWKTIIEPDIKLIGGQIKMEEHTTFVVWSINIKSNVPLNTLTINGKIRLTLFNSKECFVPSYIPFKATIIKNP
jgi:hypothetical protein